jgi:hypothetical protein
VSRKGAQPLPDLEDAEFVARLRPLEQAVVPGGQRRQQEPAARSSLTGDPDIRSAGPVAAAQRFEEMRQVKGEKRRFEYLLPERVGRALADEAAKTGVSASLKLLEILQNAGYPVIREDFTDLRKLPRRG